MQKTVFIAATYACNPIETALRFWIDYLELPLQWELYPQNQVFQKLLSPDASANSLNVFLLRLQDWSGGGRDWPERLKKTRKNVEEFIERVRQSGQTTHVTVLCPATGEFAANPEFLALEAELYAQLQASLDLAYTPADVMALYEVTTWENPDTDKLADIPYQEEAFTALGAFIARKWRALLEPPYKVIALDCDETLWRGICGEVGSQGICLGEAELQLQRFLIRQKEQGMLLCLCSKNNPDDVFDVFKSRSDMLLSLEHVVATQIHWEPKSVSLWRLAQELNVGLDSFIFIDDNPMECAEVSEALPQVLAVQRPLTENLDAFLNHLWAVDKLKITDEDTIRTRLYRQEKHRKQEARQAGSMADFLSSLQLKVAVEDINPDTVARIAQLNYRTNQFNLTGLRQSEADIAEICKTAPHRLKVVQAQDRFGDYGIVGGVFLEEHASQLHVINLFVSCRALNRGVEHVILNRLADEAAANRFDQIVLHYRQTEKNTPARRFLESLFHEAVRNETAQYAIEVETARSIAYTPSADSEPEAVEAKPSAASGERRYLTSDRQQTILADYSTIAAIERHLRSIRPQAQRETVTTLAAAQTPLELELKKLWEEILNVQPIGLDDHFFDLGGSSLQFIQLISKIRQKYQKELSLAQLFENPVIRSFSRLLESDGNDVTETPLLMGLNTQGSRHPLFCVIGDVTSTTFIRLPQLLGKDQPFYFLQNGLKKLEASELSISGIARLYVQQIRSTQPEGPYNIMGYCTIVAKIAIEVARQLSEAGQPVRLFIFDPGPLKPPSRFKNGTLLMLFRLKQFLQMNWKEKRAYCQFLGTRLPLKFKKMAESRRNQAQPVLTDRSLNPDAYEVPHISGDMYLFLSSDSHNEFLAGRHARRAWTELADHSELYEYKGPHFTMLKDPHVVQVAGIMKDRLY